ncbi:serine/threonine protein kinase [Streptacidiphilus pinicola]|uniref:Serine/threonine protein kinase n=2 Tax=Streptacidiphilus pinicola TaxID=2219663 RepID=A0A2X0I605_9ACTN|nr:serine/threonine-protein kinase [Streptacidiphilus pinicola]RAG80394.1 serine/threonine protein kinase [Streptacidiphilus pinicola]
MRPLGTDDPSTVGPYRLIALLGAGGMGKVYLARSAGGRTVAVKVVRPELAGDPGFRERFRREVAAAQAVDGAFTAPVVDADRDSAAPWLATAYVLGPTLAEAVAEHGPMPERTVRALGAVLAEALTAIHAAGLVHRDLKPSNVLLAADGPRVIDFGIARALDGSGATTTGVIVGSPGFMSPEQASGRKVGPAGDVFALGSVLAFAATGQGPFSAGAGDAATLLYRVVHEEPDLAQVPGTLRPVLAACLAKDPAGRPTPAQVRDLLAAEGAAALLRGAWLPAEISGGIARHAAHVLELETPAPFGRAAPDTDAAPAAADAAGTSREPGRAPSRRGLLLGGLSAVGVVALGGLGYALAGGGGKRAPAAGPTAGPTATPTPTRPPGVAPQPLWTYAASRQLGNPPYLVDGRLLVADTNLTALDPRSGKVAWTGPQISAGTQQRPMARGAGLVLQLDDGNQVTAVDPATGAQRWTVPTPPQFGFTTVLGANDTTVFVTGQQFPLDKSGRPVISLNSSDSVIVAIDLGTRKVRWVQHRRTSNDWEVLGFATAKYVVYTNDANNVVARDQGTGAQVWSQTYGDPHATITELPLLGGDTVFLPGSRLLGYGLAKGEQRLTVQASGTSSYQALGYADGTVFATLHDSAVALDARSGTTRWSTPIVPTVGLASMLVVGPTAFCPVLTGNGTSSGLAALDRATGHLRWTFQDGGTDDDWWMETDGTVLYVTHGERVYGLPAT